MSREPQTALLGLDLQELTALVEEAGEASYRARQLFDAVYGQRVLSTDQISTLPKSFRGSLQERGMTVGLPTVEKKFVSRDGTVRYLVGLGDGQRWRGSRRWQRGGR